jgi:hypothetical protein
MWAAPKYKMAAPTVQCKPYLHCHFGPSKAQHLIRLISLAEALENDLSIAANSWAHSVALSKVLGNVQLKTRFL